jgi:low temperature requirement protein LtrA
MSDDIVAGLKATALLVVIVAAGVGMWLARDVMLTILMMAFTVVAVVAMWWIMFTHLRHPYPPRDQKFGDYPGPN